MDRKAGSDAPVDDPRRHSLQWRLPMLISGLFIAVLAAVVYAAYHEVDATLERGAGERAQQAAQQVAAIFAPSSIQTAAQLQRLNPALRPVLRDASPAALAEARRAVAALTPTPAKHVTLWDAAGTRLFEEPGPDSTDVVPRAERVPAEGVGRIQAAGELAFVDYASAVTDEDGTRLGWVSVRSVLSVTPPDALSRLIGGDARIVFSNRDGDVWTDLAKVTAGPAVSLQERAPQVYRNAQGEERIGALQELAGTPWVVWVGFPRAASTAEARAFLWRMGAIVLAVAVAAVLLMRQLVTSVTTPLTAMTTAAEAIAGGDYSRRVAAAGYDEIGRLGRAFNVMSSDVERELAERKRAHERLQEREAQLTLYAEHIPVSVAMFDREMRYLVASRHWVEDFELGDQPLAGRSHYELFPDLPERWIEIHKRCLAGAIEKADEDPFPRPDGTMRWIRWEVRPWHQAGGAIGGIIVFSEDITERKRTQMALAESEGRYHTLFDYAPDGILIRGADRRYVDVNPAMCQMMRMSREQLIGLRAEDIVAPVDQHRIPAGLQAVLGDASVHSEWTLRRGDGSTFAADVISTRMPDGNVLAMFRDVSDRNQAVEAVRTAEERMRYALQSAGVGIWEADYRTHVTRWSETMEAIYGLPPGGFDGSQATFQEFIHHDDRERVARIVTETMRSGGDFSLGYRIVRRDGTVRWITGLGQIHLAPDGTPVRGIGISLDVTERQILEAQFQQAQKMEAVGRLAGGVAHDFNNLLTAILGYCGLLLDDLKPEDPLRHDILEIQKAGGRAAELTRQLLAFSRKQIIEPALIDLNDVVAGLRSLLSRLINEDVEIVTGLSAEPMLITADRGQIEQIIVNLAVNARDAMPMGGRLTIQTAHVELDEDYAAVHLGVKPGHYVALTMTDTGVGMNAEVQSHLFEPFFTTKELGKGTGLGLATVHGVVARSGGSIGVYSEVGKGTSFKVYLPRASAVAVPADAPKTSAAPLRGDGRTILVVDDADALRELMQKTLQRQGYNVLVAANAAEAQRQFDQHPGIDVLLTDVVMPGASGPELTAGLLARRPALKVIYMSGYTEDAIVHHGVLRPGIAFLHKPFTADALGHKIREVLGR